VLEDKNRVRLVYVTLIYVTLITVFLLIRVIEKLLIDFSVLEKTTEVLGCSSISLVSSDFEL